MNGDVYEGGVMEKGCEDEGSRKYLWLCPCAPFPSDALWKASDASCSPFLGPGGPLDSRYHVLASINEQPSASYT